MLRPGGVVESRESATIVIPSSAVASGSLESLVSTLRQIQYGPWSRLRGQQRPYLWTMQTLATMNRISFWTRHRAPSTRPGVDHRQSPPSDSQPLLGLRSIGINDAALATCHNRIRASRSLPRPGAVLPGRQSAIHQCDRLHKSHDINRPQHLTKPVAGCTLHMCLDTGVARRSGHAAHAPANNCFPLIESATGQGLALLPLARPATSSCSSNQRTSRIWRRTFGPVPRVPIHEWM